MLRTLFAEMMNTPDRPGYDDRNEVLNALVVLYPHFDRALSPPSYPPFEEFLSLAVTAQDLSCFDEHYWPAKTTSALRLLTGCLAAKSADAEKSPLLRQFVEQLRLGDIIITFNWDPLIERALLALDRPFDLKERRQDRVTILKLHGSLSWVLVPEGVRLADPSDVDWLSDRVCCTKNHTYYDVWDPLDQSPFIVPPVISKRPPTAPFLEHLWREAFAALVEAGPVIIIGYSLPADDLQARTLLRSGLYPKLTAQKSCMIIDPDPLVGSRYFTLIANSISFRQAYFSEGVLSILDSDDDRK
ncbi:SIR2 family protein [Candidatus Woesearchaeota archaeon]|nr:SIR2 family protein [Candidatus Woesearchaeota archaeon]